MIGDSVAMDLEEFIAEGREKEIRVLFEDMNPADAGEALVDIPPESAAQASRILGPAWSASVFSRLPPDFVKDLSGILDGADMAAILSLMEADKAAKIARLLPDAHRTSLLRAMEAGASGFLRQLLGYVEGSAGAMMTKAALTADFGSSTGDVLVSLKSSPAYPASRARVYLIDVAGTLKGAVELSCLLAARPETPLSDICALHPIHVNVLNDDREAVNLIARYGLSSIPVVDTDDKLLGEILHSDAMAALEGERAELFGRFAAVGGSKDLTPYPHVSAWSQYLRRVWRLLALAGLGLLAGAMFLSLPAGAAKLAAIFPFLPLVLGAGGNAAAQSAAQVARALVRQDMKPRNLPLALWKELRIGVLLALTLGLSVFCVVLFTGEVFHSSGLTTSLDLALAIGCALIVQVLLSTVAGALLPFGAAWMGAHPAFVSGPALGALSDLLGLAVYFAAVRLFVGI